LKRLSYILKRLLAAIPEVKAAAIVSAEGLPIASALPQGVDETKIAAMTAALLSLAERSVMEMEKGMLDQIYVKGTDGYLLALQCGPKAILTISTTNDVRLGLIFLDCKRTCEKIADLIMGDFEDVDKSEVELFCKYCGRKLIKKQKFCRFCGKKVE